MICAVIFDMDGLLVDNAHLWFKAERQILSGMGIEVDYEYVQSFAGFRTIEEVRAWKNDFGFTEPDDQVLADQVEGAVRKLVETEGKPLPGVVKLIEELASYHIPMAVASSSAMELITTTLRKIGVAQYMQAVHSGEHEKRGKPFPDVFLSAAKALDVEPEHCLVLEDALVGVQAAKTAGMKCIAVPEAGYDQAAFESKNPDMIVDSMENVGWNLIKEM